MTLDVPRPWSLGCWGTSVGEAEVVAGVGFILIGLFWLIGEGWKSGFDVVRGRMVEQDDNVKVKLKAD